MNDSSTRRVNDTRTRRGAAVGAIAALATVGALLTLAGILLMTVPFHDGTIPQWNGLCSSDVGQIGQFLDSSAQHDCGMVSVADHLIGWLLGLGILALAGSGLLWLGRARPAQ
jgi:hypothetical protein